MARVKGVSIDRVADDIKPIYRKFTGEYGDFTNQARALAHSPEAMRALYGLLLAWREVESIPRRLVEIAVVTVSRLNRCEYCVAHHAPVLSQFGLAHESIEQILESNPPGFVELDLLVRDYARLVTERPWGIRDGVFERLREHFDEAQIVELTVRIALCGLFNKFNKALQVDMEESAMSDLFTVGPQDSCRKVSP